MQKLFAFVKKHALVLILLAILIYILFGNFLSQNILFTGQYVDDASSYKGLGIQGPSAVMDTMYTESSYDAVSPIYNEASPRLDVTDRMIVSNSSVSAVVQDVNVSVNSIQQQATKLGGYMVHKNINTPDEGGNGFITVRVPSDQMDAMIEFVEANSLKVVNIDISGTDVTDQYIDSEERLADLEKTKAIFEGILEEAKDVDEIMRVHERIIQIQNQIDSIKGQLQYLEQTSASVAISINLSTDEYSLPYVPNDGWNPDAIFKTAVRSLVGFVRWVGSALIWIGVYAPVWIVALLVVWIVKKRKNNSKPKNNQTP